jgi:hypothetical protein
MKRWQFVLQLLGVVLALIGLALYFLIEVACWPWWKIREKMNGGER